uniref:Protein kinase domain-containing protein n=1 Tax=Bursaphelenchus xylophilus TaxID=6326 RepID=A0A1I7SFF6_BURXY
MIPYRLLLPKNCSKLNFQIEERIGFDDRFGATYFVTPQKSDRPLELVLRLDNTLIHTPSVLLVEIALLRKANEHRKHNLFAQLHDHGCFETDYYWYTTYFKGGPTLRQITEFMSSSRGSAKLSYSTVGRFGYNLYQILGFMHSCNFILCSLDQDMFHFDAASRTLFLADLSTVRPKPKSKTDVRWSGNLNYTPLGWSDQIQNPIPADTLANLELEAVFYLILELTMGELPWGRDHTDQVAQKKISNFNSNSQYLKHLPETYHTLWNNIMDIVSSPGAYSDIQPILGLCKQIYEKHGHCKSWDDDFDFERQPTPEELPRFVMEKVPAEGEAVQEPGKSAQQVQEDIENEGQGVT